MAEMKVDIRNKLQVIRALLLEHWDPIGERCEVAAQDEYDQYLPTILSLLERGASAADLARYLGKVATLDMGLVEVAERDRAAAERLVQLRLR